MGATVLSWEEQPLAWLGSMMTKMIVAIRGFSAGRAGVGLRNSDGRPRIRCATSGRGPKVLVRGFDDEGRPEGFPPRQTVRFNGAAATVVFPPTTGGSNGYHFWKPDVLRYQGRGGTCPASSSAGRQTLNPTLLFEPGHGVGKYGIMK